MREVEFAKQQYSKFKKSKPITKSNLFVIYFITFIMLVFAFMTHNKFLIFSFFTMLAFVINSHTNLITFRIDFGQEVFLSLLLTWVYGLAYGLALIFISEIIADFMTGRIDKDTFISIVFSVIINAVLIYFRGLNFVLIAVILVTIKFVFTLIINLAMGLDAEELIFETGLNFATNVFLLVSFGNFFLGMIS